MTLEIETQQPEDPVIVAEHAAAGVAQQGADEYDQFKIVAAVVTGDKV